MSVDIASIYNIDANGTATGGCFYKSDAGTTDYSQQNSPQWTSTNVSSDVAGTQITDDDAAGTVTDQLVGNGVYLTGGDGFTTGWYEVKTVIDGDNFTIDRSAGASKSGGTANIGGSLSVFLDLMGTGMVAGNRIMVKNGNYSLTETISWVAGTSTVRVWIIGYNTSYTDLATGDDRPNITCGAFELQPQAYNVTIGLRGTFTGTYGIRALSQHEKVINCHFDKTTASSSSAAIIVSADSVIAGCGMEVLAGTSTWGLYGNNDTAHIKGSFAKGATTGIEAYENSFNITSGCGTGILVRGDGYAINNTVYDCTTGILLSSFICDALNNDINSCTTGITGNATREEYLDWNNYFNNTADVSNATKGANATATNPGYTDAVNDNFTNGLEAVNGMPYGFTSNIKQGAAQSESNGGVQVAYIG